MTLTTEDTTGSQPGVLEEGGLDLLCGVGACCCVGLSQLGPRTERKSVDGGTSKTYDQV